MTSPRQAAAARWEEDVARDLRGHGFRAAERQRVKHPDRGDIGGVPDWTIECKGIAPGNGHKCPCCQQPLGRFDMARAMDQAMRARITNGDPYAMVVRKRSGMPASRSYVIVELDMFGPIMRRLDET